MNYYIIPKNNCQIHLDLKRIDKIHPHISHSLFYYLTNLNSQIKKVQYYNNESVNEQINEITIDYINKIVNPFEFVHSIVPGSNISVSKVKPESKIFFEMFEIFQLFSINDFLSLKQKINIAHLTPNHSSTNYFLNMLREDDDDTIVCEDFVFKQLYSMFLKNQFEHKLDLLICEFNDYTDTRSYIKNMLLTFAIIVKYQASDGVCIIKIDNVFYKPIIDIIFALSTIYDKIFIIKPTISDIATGERYIVCKSFNVNGVDFSNLLHQVETKVIPKLDTKECDFHYESVIKNNIPYFFLNKIEESNAVIGQQQLEAYDFIINIFKNKNRDEKIESIKRTHIQKCINWCEKNQLPHNKFVDKINIFLTARKKESEEEEKEEEKEKEKEKDKSIDV